MGGLNQGEFNRQWIESKCRDVLGCAERKEKVAFEIGYIDSDLILYPFLLTSNRESYTYNVLVVILPRFTEKLARSMTKCKALECLRHFLSIENKAVASVRGVCQRCTIIDTKTKTRALDAIYGRQRRLVFNVTS